MPSTVREIEGVLRAAAVATGIYVLPWVLAVVGWSFSSLTEPPIEVERYEPPAGVLLTLEPEPEPGVDEPEAPVDEDVAEDEDAELAVADDAVEPVPSRPGHEGTADADDAPSGGPRVLAVAGDDGEGVRKRRKRRRRGPSCKDPHPHVRTAGDGVVEVDRSLVEEYTRNLESFMKLGYSRPYDDQGVKGWYISGFSCLSPVHKAGFRRGDVLLTVNGKKTRTWVGVFLMYQKLKKKERFEVALVRKGRPVTLAFRVVD